MMGDETGRADSRSADNQALRGELQSREQQLQNLTCNIPGGVHQCLNDRYFTLVGMSEGFLSMFGYSREDVQELFDGRFINMIIPVDRPRVLRETITQLRYGPDIEMEYRVLCKNGKLLWILDKGRLLDDRTGRKCFYCILIEITDRKREQEELRLSLERHQVIMDQATDIIFEWDIRRDTLQFSPNWRKKFGYDPINQSISGRIPLSENIHPKDMPAFIKLMRDTAAGEPYSEVEFRIRDIKRHYLWCRIRATAQFDAERQPIKAVGVIVDIDAEKKQKQALMDQAQRDALTGLYNKAAINALVEGCMQGRELTGRQALMIIDVDHFKAVNDTYGHLCGDTLLSDVAMELKKHTRRTDLVGRIGGDEFLIYLPQVADEAAARSKAEDILQALQLLAPEKGAPPISCSIGVALFPRGGIDYYALYKCADQALYFQKNNGRGGVMFFSPVVCCGRVPSGMSPSAVGEAIGSDDGNVVDEMLAQYAFRTLYEADDLESALIRLLEIVGRSYDVSRTYIFECSPDGKRCCNTYEWCNESALPQMNRLQEINYSEDLGDYQTNFNADGVFYCRDVCSLAPRLRAVLEPQGIRSMLQCAMLDEGRFWGYVGFDECRTCCTWSKGQIASFKLTANVLSTFLSRLRLKQRLDRLRALPHSEG